MKVTALLTGRGNNTLMDKNIQNILGHPVLYYPAHAAKKCNLINTFYCSSDDEKILAAAEKEGFLKIKRPANLALPTSQHIECIMHALEYINSNGDYPDILVVLLANNVTIKSEWITDCINEMIKDKNVTAVVPVYEDNDHHPLRAKRIENNRIQMYEKNVIGTVSTNRQDLTPCYFLSHNFWVLDVSYLKSKAVGQQPWGFMGDNIIPYIIDNSIDIHNNVDLIIAKDWVERYYKDI